jgi:hypothetical protein
MKTEQRNNTFLRNGKMVAKIKRKGQRKGKKEKQK